MPSRQGAGWLARLGATLLYLQAAACSQSSTSQGKQLSRDTTLSSKWVEQISRAPRAYVYHNFLTPEECAHIVNISRPMMRRSTVVGQGGKSVEDNIRTSYGTFLRRLQDPIITSIEQRLATWTMLDISHQEDMQILRYEDHQQYGAHYDSISAESPRVATVLFYLGAKNLVGGETAFPKDSEWLGGSEQGTELGPWSKCAEGHVAMKPRKGDALLFYSLEPGGQSDVHSMHTGCPVLNGTKWTATKWIHTKPFNPEWLKATQAPALEQDPGLCLDSHEMCASWAASGECDKNPAYMQGDSFSVGSCRAACKTCRVCGKNDAACQANNRMKAGFLPLHLDDWE